MRVAGAAVSAAGHAAFLGLALWISPWLRVRPQPPQPGLSVSFITPAELAARARPAVPAPEPSPSLPPATAPKAPRPAVAGPRFLPPEEPPPPEPPPLPAPEETTLAPSFDAAAPLGLPEEQESAAPETDAGTEGVPGAAAPPAAEAGAEAEGGAEAEAGAEAEEPASLPDLAVLRVRHMQALAAALTRARVYPPAAVGRGLMGTARLYVEVGRDGTLVEARLVASSGSATLDRAALEAAQRARWPAAAAELPGESFAFLQDLAFRAR